MPSGFVIADEIGSGPGVSAAHTAAIPAAVVPAAATRRHLPAGRCPAGKVNSSNIPRASTGKGIHVDTQPTVTVIGYGSSARRDACT